MDTKKEHKHSVVYVALYTGLPFFEVGDAIRLIAETNRIDVISVKVMVEDDDEHARNATILIQVRTYPLLYIFVWNISFPCPSLFKSVISALICRL